MRVMVMVKANKDSEAGIMPKQKLLAEMGKFNEDLVKAGVLLAADGLQPSSKGKRVRFSAYLKTELAENAVAWLWMRIDRKGGSLLDNMYNRLIRGTTSDNGDVCKLAVTHELADAPKTAQHVSKDGWTLVLSGLKTLLETGESMPMPEAAA